MKKVQKFQLFLLVPTLLMAISIHITAQKQNNNGDVAKTIITNVTGTGQEIIVSLDPGAEHNHPMLAIWLEDEGGNFIQTLFVNESVAKGYFKFADRTDGKWKAGKLIRPASLPVWAHKRGKKSADDHFMPTQEQPVPDAYTSATPEAGFVLESRADRKLKGKVKVFVEINQSWDWNEFWTNSKYPDDEEYKSSSQPSVVYAVEIDSGKSASKLSMNPIGHGHYSGKDGIIYTDLSTLTTALEIVRSVSVEIK